MTKMTNVNEAVVVACSIEKRQVKKEKKAAQRKSGINVFWYNYIMVIHECRVSELRIGKKHCDDHLHSLMYFPWLLDSVIYIVGESWWPEYFNFIEVLRVGKLNCFRPPLFLNITVKQLLLYESMNEILINLLVKFPWNNPCFPFGIDSERSISKRSMTVPSRTCACVTSFSRQDSTSRRVFAVVSIPYKSHSRREGMKFTGVIFTTTWRSDCLSHCFGPSEAALLHIYIAIILLFEKPIFLTFVASGHNVELFHKNMELVCRGMITRKTHNHGLARP